MKHFLLPSACSAQWARSAWQDRASHLKSRLCSTFHKWQALNISRSVGQLLRLTLTQHGCSLVCKEHKRQRKNLINASRRGDSYSFC